MTPLQSSFKRAVPEKSFPNNQSMLRLRWSTLWLFDSLKTPWFRRHGSAFTGQILPLGCGVYFKPAPTKYEVSKAAPRLQFGIFLGYRLHPGGKWNGEYFVADLDDFAGKSLFEDTSHFEWPNYSPHITKIVRLPKEGVYFPLRNRYQRDNCTLEGRDEFAKQLEPGGAT